MTQSEMKGKISQGIRLNKFLGEAGICSRREADRMIEEGRVTVDGVPGTAGMKIGKGQKICVDGVPVAKEREAVLLAVNKPAGVVCTTEKKWGDPTLEELVHYPKRVFSVGRLDKDSEGLILMTNQGDILNKIMKAGNYHEKEYVVTVDKKVTPDFIKRMSKGVFLKELNVTTRPCKVEMAGEKRFRIILTQGLNRQIRRMCAFFGYRVVRLVRVRIMNVELGNLPVGQYRHLTKQETAVLMDSLKRSVNNTELSVVLGKQRQGGSREQNANGNLISQNNRPGEQRQDGSREQAAGRTAPGKNKESLKTGRIGKHTGAPGKRVGTQGKHTGTPGKNNQNRRTKK